MDKSTEIIFSILEQIKKTPDRLNMRLPTEAEMCTQYNTNRTTLRRALEILQYFNIIKGVRGSGYIVTFDSNDFSETAAKLLNLYHFDFRDISDVREALELKVVALIQKQHRPASDFSNLEEYVEIMKSGGIDAVSADQRFHQELARLSNNQLVMAITDAIGQYSKRYMEEYWTVSKEPKGISKTSLADTHQEVLETIKSNKTIKIDDNPVTRHYKLSYELISPTFSAEPDVASELKITDLLKRGWSSEQILELVESLKRNSSSNNL